MSDDNKKLYDFRHVETAFGIEHKFSGPNMPQYANGIHLMQPMNDWANKCMPNIEHADRDAKMIVNMLRLAYEAGRDSMAYDIKKLLMIKDHHF